MKKYHVTIYLVLSVLGAAALWYFGHHRPAEEARNSPPTVIYKAAPPVVQNLETAKAPAQPISHTDNIADVAPRETQTETPGATDRNLDTPPPTNAHTGESHPMATDQTMSPETSDTADTSAEREAERADWEARDQALQESLENAEIVKLQMALEMMDYLNTLSTEEQLAHFEMMKKMLYEDIPRLHPGEDTPEDLDRLWNSVLSDLILVGYTPPEGVTLK